MAPSPAHRGVESNNHRPYRVRQLIQFGGHRAAFSLAHAATRTRTASYCSRHKASCVVEASLEIRLRVADAKPRGRKRSGSGSSTPRNPRLCTRFRPTGSFSRKTSLGTGQRTLSASELANVSFNKVKRNRGISSDDLGDHVTDKHPHVTLPNRRQLLRAKQEVLDELDKRYDESFSAFRRWGMTQEEENQLVNLKKNLKRARDDLRIETLADLHAWAVEHLLYDNAETAVDALERLEIDEQMFSLATSSRGPKEHVGVVLSCRGLMRNVRLLFESEKRGELPVHLPTMLRRHLVPFPNSPKKVETPPWKLERDLLKGPGENFQTSQRTDGPRFPLF